MGGRDKASDHGLRTRDHRLSLAVSIAAAGGGCRLPARRRASRGDQSRSLDVREFRHARRAREYDRNGSGLSEASATKFFDFAYYPRRLSIARSNGSARWQSVSESAHLGVSGGEAPPATGVRREMGPRVREGAAGVYSVPCLGFLRAPRRNLSRAYIRSYTLVSTVYGGTAPSRRSGSRLEEMGLRDKGGGGAACRK